MTRFPFPNNLPMAGLLLLIGLAGALLADWAGVPMPYLVGGLCGVGLFSGWRTARGMSEAKFPQGPRKFFVALIGTMIGASFSAELMASLPSIWPSLLVMIVFVAVAIGAGGLMFRHIGGYDPMTATYSAMPGGLVEAVAIGEEAGGDVRTLALQHFARIVIVVVTVPFLYLIWSGQSVGSAAGQSFEAGTWTILDIVVFFALAIVGVWLGPKLRLPASHLVGPLLLSAALHGAGLLHLSAPTWLLALAQLVVGAGLGTSFAGAKLRDLFRAFGLGAIYVFGVLTLAYETAVALSWALEMDFDTLFVSFAPGGVTEMGLIALSLGISPVIVAAHHVFRIALTVFLAGVLAKRFLRSDP